MTTRYEVLYSKKDEWVSLSDVCDENNKINTVFESFLRAFSVENGLIFVSLFQYGVLSGLVDKAVKDNLLIFAPTFPIEDIPQYLNKNSYIIYPIASDHSIYQDYSREEKRQDFITRIYINQVKNNVPFSYIAHIAPSILSGFRILCNINSNGKITRNIDFLEYWSKFDQDDLISITSDLVPKIYFDWA
jgi:hypothetical protein